MRAQGLLCGLLALALLAGGCQKKDRDLTTDLHRAARKGDLSQVQMLIARGANVNARDNEGRTPLHLAAESGHEEVVEVLVRCGVRIDCEDKSGLTPAMLAMFWGRRTVVERLVQMGATVDLDLAVYLGDTEKAKSLIRSGAASLGEAASTKGRLKADVMIGGRNTWTPLHYAAARDSNQELVRLLLTHHANVNARNRGGIAPLCYAASGGAVNLALLLLADGAEVNARDNGGDTALHRAALHGHKEVVQLLLVHGADVNARNSRGRTPLDEAHRRGHADVVQLLTAKTEGASAGTQERGAGR